MTTFGVRATMVFMRALVKSFSLLITVGTLSCDTGRANGSAATPTATMGTAAIPSVQIDPNLPSARAAAEVQRELRQLGMNGRECHFLWGDAGPMPDSASPLRLTWGTADTIDGWAICEADVEAKMADPRLHQMATMTWDGNELLVGHPSGPGKSGLPKHLDPELEREAKHTLGIFHGEGDAGSAANMLSHLMRAQQFFLFIMWPLGD
jgi:hypothetical protein